MAMERAQRFVEALNRLEQEGDLEGLIALFADGAQVSNLASPRVFRGVEGARQFWNEYQGTLQHVKSTFRNIIDAGDRTALEWETQGTAHNGAAVAYEGVSILEWEGDKVIRFFAYFDPYALGQELARGAGQRSEAPATAPA